MAALSSLFTLYMLQTDSLQIGHLYLINAVIGFMDAFQSPTSSVAVSLITPQKQYTRASALQSLAGNAVSLISPVFATALLLTFDITYVVLFDLFTFAACAMTLILFVRIDDTQAITKTRGDSFVSQCRAGFRFVWKNKGILQLMLFMSVVNLLSCISYFSIFSPMLLIRAGGGEAVLGFVSVMSGIGGIAGGLLAALLPEPKNRARHIFLCAAASMLLGDILFGAGRCAWIWCLAEILGNLPLASLNGAEQTLYRLSVPQELQGRVFSIRTALQFGTMPIGTLLGGFLAEKVFEPFMLGGSAAAAALQTLTGAGPGSGMALMFVITGVLGGAMSLLFLFSKHIRALDERTRTLI